MTSRNPYAVIWTTPLLVDIYERAALFMSSILFTSKFTHAYACLVSVENASTASMKLHSMFQMDLYLAVRTMYHVGRIDIGRLYFMKGSYGCWMLSFP